MSLRQPQGQTRTQYGRDFGNFSSLDECPNASLYAGSADAVAMLEVGDRAYVTGSGPAHCTAAGSAGMLDAVWALDAPAAATGLLFELDTTVTTDLSATTEGGIEDAFGGGPAGTLTPSANIANPAMASAKDLRLTGDAALTGVLIRRVLCGVLPTEGWILDIGIGDLTVDAGGDNAFYPVIMFGYQQEAGAAPANFTGLGLQFRLSAANINVIACGDDGAGSFVPTQFGSVDNHGQLFDPTDFTRGVGARRLVIEFQQLGGQTPAQWSVRVTVYCFGGPVYSTTLSGVFYPEAGFPTPVAIDGANFTRIGLGVWGFGTHGGTWDVSHLRVYSLGSPIPP